MKTKRCNRCNEVKLVSEFYSNSRAPDGIDCRCKECNKISSYASRKTKAGVVGRMYNKQKESSVKRGHLMPTYSKSELREWLFSQKLFHELYDRWKGGGFERGDKPSCDRIDDYRGYTLSNLRLVTWDINNRSYDEDRKRGINNKLNKGVVQLSMGGEFIAEYYSIAQASRETGVPEKHIPDVCSGKRNHTGGYKWKYKDN